MSCWLRWINVIESAPADADLLAPLVQEVGSAVGGDLVVPVPQAQVELDRGFRIHTLESAGDHIRLAGDHFQGDDVSQIQDLVWRPMR